MIAFFKRHKEIAILIVLAFILGLGNPLFDYPLAFTVGDEFESQKVALETLSSKSLVHSSAYLPLWTWVQTPFLVLAILFTKILGGYPSFEAVKQEVLLFSPGAFLFVPRILSSLFSALSLIWLFKLGNVLKSKRVGLLAALLFSFTFMRVHQASFGRVTSVYLFASLGFLYYLISYVKSANPKHMYLVIGFLTASIAAYPMGIALLPLVITVLFFFSTTRSVLHTRRFWLLILLNVGVLGMLVAITPGILLSYFPQISITSQTLTLGSKFLFYVRTLLWYDLPVVVLGMVGLRVLCLKTGKTGVIIWLFGIVACLPFLVKGTAEPRYIFLLFIPFIVSASFFLDTLLTQRKLPAYLLIGLTILLSLIPVVRFKFLLYRKSTYLLAKDYLEKEIPQNKPLLVNRNNFYLLPSLESQEPKELFSDPYYQSLRSILSTMKKGEIEKMKQVKFIHSLSNMRMLAKKANFTVETDKYDFVVFDYYTQGEKQVLMEEIRFNPKNYELVKTFSPADSFIPLPSLLNIHNPYKHLFSVDRFGPYFEVYEKNENEEIKDSDKANARF